MAHKIGPAQLERLIQEAIARFDPEQAEADRAAAAEAGVTWTWTCSRSAPPGPSLVEAELDLADALDFNTAISDDAHQQLLAGSTESLDVRRSIAAGNLARHQTTLDLAGEPDSTGHPPQA